MTNNQYKSLQTVIGQGYWTPPELNNNQILDSERSKQSLDYFVILFYLTIIIKQHHAH